jgi:hypothetical protein
MCAEEACEGACGRATRQLAAAAVLCARGCDNQLTQKWEQVRALESCCVKLVCRLGGRLPLGCGDVRDWHLFGCYRGDYSARARSL